MKRIFLIFALLVSGCSSIDRRISIDKDRDRFGRLYYIDGAGNWGIGESNIKSAFKEYPGNIIIFNWTCSFSQAIDQTIGRVFARQKGIQLAKEIVEYKKRHQKGTVDIISLSAGTGVAIWACENLEPGVKVNKVFLLSSSLSYDYNPTKAIRSVSKMWVFCSPKDLTLGAAVKVVGTIDGKVGVPCVGERGFLIKDKKICQIDWNESFATLGWTGGHYSVVSSEFTKYLFQIFCE